MDPVESDAIAEIGHDPSTNTLRVKFTNGGLYDFHNVSAEKHQALMDAGSKGKHFQLHIRYHHDFTRIS